MRRVAGGDASLTPPQRWALADALTACSPGGAGALGEVLSCVVEGPLAVPAVAGAWRRVLAGRAELCHAFTEGGSGPPIGPLPPRASLALEVADLAPLPAPARRAALACRVSAEMERGFAAGRPLARLGLVRLAAERWQLLLSYHPVAVDRAGAARLVAQVLAASRGQAQRSQPAGLGRSSAPLPAAPDDAAAEAFWRRSLAGFAAATPLGVDRPPGGASRGPSGTATLAVAAPPSGWLELHRVTADGLLAGAWALLLSRYGGGRDLLFGVRTGIRPPEAGTDPCLTTLPLRVEVDERRTTAAWLRRVTAALTALGRHPWVTPEQIRAWSDVPPGRPLFETVVRLPGRGAGAAAALARRIAGLRVREACFAAPAWHPLEISAVSGPAWSLTARYDRKRFAGVTAVRLLRHLRALLAAAVAGPDRPLGGLSPVTAGERHQLLCEWNDSARRPPPGRVLPEPFAAQVEVTPDAVAISAEDHWWSYRQLDARAATLARRLAAQGAGPEARIAVYAPRGVGLLIALLAVWKAECAYLPLDLRHPTPRLARLLARSGARHLIAAAIPPPALERLLAELAPGERPVTLTLSERRPVPDPPPAGRLPAREGPAGRLPAPAGTLGGDPRSLAYVLYTSGSTGSPKGAMIDQRGMLNHLWAKVDDLGLSGGDVVAQTAPVSFDISIWQLVAPLLVGARVAIAADEVACNPGRLLGWVEERSVTVLELVPAVLSALLSALREGADPGVRPAAPAALRWLLVTGEPLPPDLCRRAAEELGGLPLINAYGPTECSDDVAHHAVTRSPAAAATRVPIGRPVANLRLFVVDVRGRPVPAGVTGELWVAGPGVGRGYLGAAAMTAEVFVPAAVAVAAAPGERFYRTGDRVRQRLDGRLEVLGRLDRQVKVRGQRLEPGEVEAVLARHPQVAAAAVVVVEDGAGGLVGCLQAAGPSVPEPGELRAFLSRHLPGYMVPARFLAVESLPLTANGKVDRRALAAHALAQPRVPGGRAPDSELEMALAGIWRRVLGRDDPARDAVGIDDNFFDLGGHSLDLARVHSEMVSRLGVEISLLELFRYPTLRSLAARLSTPLPAAAGPPRDQASARLAAGSRRQRARERRRAARGASGSAGIAPAGEPPPRVPDPTARSPS